MSADIVLHSLAALAYLLLSLSIWRPILQQKSLSQTGSVKQVCILATLLLHGIAVHWALIYPDHLKLNWSLGLSITIWLGMIVFWIESRLNKLDGLLLLLLPIATLICLLAAFFPPGTNSLVIPSHSHQFKLHLLASLFAYSLIAIAAIQAFLMTALDQYLHKPVNFQENAGLLSRILEAQPPLMLQERILFRLIWIGFSVLTLSIITGSMVSLSQTSQILPFDHKTFFTLLSWLVFGVLLLGRSLWGWRGRLALRWTLVGFALLMLAYTGTRFIFEVVLNKGIA
ncbi:MAG: cytochrome c biogenesis protein CcsA [Alcaligenaceae bacterium]|nr:cytochrome c biogenesis protein CcsA [Alcaligenaceae bacterium]